MTVRNLDKLFRPKSVAIIGASDKVGSLGNLVVRNLLSAGFKGNLYAVNPRGGRVEGMTVYARTEDLPAPPDLAVILTPPDTVPEIVTALGKLSCRAAVVLTAGFGEGGSAEGGHRRSALLDAARPHLFRVIGPNCLGIVVPGLGLDASFARTSALPGGLALVAQSGAVASAMLDWARPRAIGFSHVVTLGDMIDVDFGDMLDYLCDDPSARAVLLYVEGITQARKFMSAARRCARIKPVLVVKGGRHAQSAKVAASHTGALAGADEIYDAAFARAGIMRVEDLDDLFTGAELLALGAPLEGDRLAIVTNGGGLGVLAADRLIAEQGRLAQLSSQTLAALNAALPPTWSGGNPVDIIGDAGSERYAAAMSAVLADPNVDAVLALHCPTSATDPLVIAKTVAAEAAKSPRKPVLTAWVGEESVGAARALLAQAHLPTFATPRDAVSGFMQLVKYRRLQETLLETPPVAQDLTAGAVAEARAVIARATGEMWLEPVEAKRLLELYGIPVNRTAAVSTPADAATLAGRWGCRVAVKIISPDIVHKSDVGGVILDVIPEMVDRDATRMLADVRQRRPEARISGILIEEMIARPSAHELFLGMTIDPTFGPVVVFGHGGTGVEVIDDKAFGFPPLNGILARSMIATTRIGKLLVGYRNRPAANIDAIVRALVGLSQMVIDHPQIIDLDINPLLADDSGMIAVDARIKVDSTKTAARTIITPYPRHLERELACAGGAPIFARALRPQDAPLLEEFGRHLSPQDLRFRFFGALREVDRRFAARLSQIDYDREMALIATRSGASKEVLAVARFHADPDNAEAEFAIAVRSDQQGQGVGFALMTYLIEVAEMRGIGRLTGKVFADNSRMLELAKALGMQRDGSDGGGVERIALELPRRPGANS